LFQGLFLIVYKLNAHIIQQMEHFEASNQNILNNTL